MMRKCAVLVGFIVLAALMPCTAQTSREDFSWSLFLVNEREYTPISAEGLVRLQSEDRIRFTLTSGADCFVYVIAQDAEGAVVVLHSDSLRRGETLTLGPLLITPPSGKETIFFAVSAGEQAPLGRALDTLQANPGSTRAGQELLNQVYGLRREISRLQENPERPLAMGGSVRGTEEDAGNAAGGILFSGAHTYVKILILEH
jgi:hypothetical protein